MNTDAERRQRAVMATDAEWERLGRAAQAAGMDRSRFVIHRALMPDALPAEVLRRALREMLALSILEERRLRQAGMGRVWEDACDAVDDWIDREGSQPPRPTLHRSPGLTRSNPLICKRHM